MHGSVEVIFGEAAMTLRSRWIDHLFDVATGRRMKRNFFVLEHVDDGPQHGQNRMGIEAQN